METDEDTDEDTEHAKTRVIPTTYPMMLSVPLAGGWLQVICRAVVDSALPARPWGAPGSAWSWATARRALAWLVPALFSAMHW
ncbi:hypothetical protein EYF80_035349 [Liparis tanakae]|uniref:Uncharacterized protein n=1 Tax=Liparis tanakae TaxID=230148 RepID=A0A4Z2GMI2_9TELE|nr:hypothetical protein EYF80_035349 [Liparis tanakae]